MGYNLGHPKCKNIYIHIQHPICGNILEKISYDHLPNFITFKAEKAPQKMKKIRIRDTTKLSHDDFLNDLSTLDLQNYQHMSTDEMTQVFHKHFLQTYNKHAPLKILSKEANKTKQKPWLTKGVLKSIKVKRRLFNNYKKTLNKAFHTKYKIYRVLINKLFMPNTKYIEI